MTFRKDINGLRAIAVLSVILFHFKITVFSGGFIGVDIFFVISGYLMTGIIFTKIDKNEFSIINFYGSRAKRIIPALAVLCITLFILGYLFLLTEDYRAVLRNIKRSLLFYSNIEYRNESGYFEEATNVNWLLHTWSLSVEWQFYIVYPLVIALLSKFCTKKIITLILIICTLISFITACDYSHTHPPTAFYLLPSRAWEMVAGGLVFLIPLTALTSRKKQVIELAGLALVFFAIFYLNEAYVWPSHYTLLPIIGTMLVLYGNGKSFITNNIISQFIGKISYSLYLWHWPIAVLLYFLVLSNNAIATIAGISAAFVLAIASYYFIERKPLFYKQPLAKLLAKYLLFIFIMGGAIVPVTASVVKKYPKENKLEKLLAEANKQEALNLIEKQKSDKPVSQHGATDNHVKAILLGDSHAYVLKDILKKTSRGKTLLLWQAGCPVLNEFNLKNEKDDKSCHQFHSRVLQKLNSYDKKLPLIISSFYSLYLSDKGYHRVTFDGFKTKSDAYSAKYQSVLVDTLCTLAKDRPVYVVKPIPTMETYVVKALAMQQYIISKPNDVVLPMRSYLKTNHLILETLYKAEKQCGVTVLDPLPYLCPDGQSCMGSKAGFPLYKDDNHLNEFGARLLLPMFEPVF